MGVFLMKQLLSTLLFFLASVQADDGLPVLKRTPLPNEVMWQLETELTGMHQKNGAVQECLAAVLQDLLQQAGLEASVENLVRVLTTPSECGTPESAIKELLLPQTHEIQVSHDGSFATICIQTRSGRTLQIFRDTVNGLSVQLIHY